MSDDAISFEDFRAAFNNAAFNFEPYAAHFGKPIKHIEWWALVYLNCKLEWLKVPDESPAIMPNGSPPYDKTYVKLCDGERVTEVSFSDFEQDSIEDAAGAARDALERTIEDPSLADSEGCDICVFAGISAHQIITCASTNNQSVPSQ